MKTKSTSGLNKAIITLTILISSSVQSFSEPSFLYPKNVEPTITVEDERESGLTLVKKEWNSLQINTTLFEVSADDEQVLLVGVQNAFGIKRVSSYFPDSSFSVTVEHQIKPDDSIVYSIEKNNEFKDGFLFTANEELEPFPDEQIQVIKERNKVIGESTK